MLTEKQWSALRQKERSPFHYWGEDAAKSGANYIVELGGRSIGKSYFWRRLIIEDWLLNGSKMAYIRRYGEDVTAAKVSNYFRGVDWNKITGGKFNGLVCRNGEMFAVLRDEKGKTVESESFGYYFALSLDEHYKSSDFPNVRYAIFEEFITSGKYLTDESNRLFNLISTIVRDGDCTCVMIGNTITRACPYFSEWSLTHVPRMIAGDVDVYKVDDTKIRVDMCAPYMNVKKKSGKMFFGAAKKMIAENEWHSDAFPKCPINPYEDSTVVHTVFFDAVGLTMRAEIRRSTDKYIFVWVTPVKFRFENIDKIRIVSDRLTSLSPYHQRYFVPLCKAEQFIFTAAQTGKIFYCDNLTGTDFASVFKALLK